MATPEFHYEDPFPLGKDETEYALLTDKYVETTEFEGKPILKVHPEALTMIAQAGMRDIAF
ncbi:MAG: fumarate hydratase, partial [Verrucomicrobia bacterium]|nr:fumarate hydratase [Verrucomicrobiota bacterium]